MTVLADKLSAAGIDTGAARLRVLAEERLRSAGLIPRAALTSFVVTIRREGGLMVALVDEETTRAAAIAYLERVARDMRGEFKVPGKPGGAATTVVPSGQSQLAAPAIPAKAGGAPTPGLLDQKRHGAPNNPAQAGGETKHQLSQDHGENVSPNSSGDEPGAAAQPISDTHAAVGRRAVLDDGRSSGIMLTQWASGRPSSSESGGGATHTTDEIQSGRGRAYPAPRSLVDIKPLREVTKTIFETCLLRDGTPIGELRYSQLDRYIGANAREAALLRMIRDYGRPADANAKISEFINMETLQRFLQKSAEVAHDDA